MDFDLHGLIGIRLLGASAGDVAAVAGQLGLTATGFTATWFTTPGLNTTGLSGRPDIVIRFVDELPTSSPVRYLGVNDVGFTDDAFLVLHSKHKAPARVQIPFEQIGKQCEILCERGLPRVPLLIDIINLTMLAKGVVPIHASAFTYRGVGVLTVGWSKGGKTEAMLAFAANGARYVGDEWIYLSPDGQTMYGVPEPIRVWDWHLQDMPQFAARIGPAARARLRAIKLARRLGHLIPGSGGPGLVGRTLHRIDTLLDGQLYVDLPPSRLFGDRLATGPASCDRLILVVSHESPRVVVRPIEAEEVAQRMAFSLREERSRLMSYYRKFRFAFPDRVNPLLEQADEIHDRLLLQVLGGKPASVVYHPYPMKLSDLFEAIRPLCHRRANPANLRSPQSEMRRRPSFPAGEKLGWPATCSAHNACHGQLRHVAYTRMEEVQPRS